MAFKSRTAERHTRFDAPSAAHFQDNPVTSLLLFRSLWRSAGWCIGFSFHLRFYDILCDLVPSCSGCWQELNGQYLEQPDQSIQGKAGVSKRKSKFRALAESSNQASNASPTLMVKSPQVHEVSFWNSRGSYFIYWQRSMERHSIGLSRIEPSFWTRRNVAVQLAVLCFQCRWAICDSGSCQHAKDGSVPGESLNIRGTPELPWTSLLKERVAKMPWSRPSLILNLEDGLHRASSLYPRYMVDTCSPPWLNDSEDKLLTSFSQGSFRKITVSNILVESSGAGAAYSVLERQTFVLMNSWHGVGLLLKQKRKGPTYLCTFWTFSTKRRKAGPIGPIRSTSPQRAMAGWRPPTRKQDDLHCDDAASQQLSWSVPKFVWQRKRLSQVFANHTALPFTHCNAFYVILCVPLAAKARREIHSCIAPWEVVGQEWRPAQVVCSARTSFVKYS